MVYLNRPYQLKFYKGCLSQILLGPFLKTLTHVSIQNVTSFAQLVPCSQLFQFFSSIPNISYKLLDSIESNQNIGTKCVNA